MRADSDDSRRDSVRSIFAILEEEINTSLRPTHSTAAILEASRSNGPLQVVEQLIESFPFLLVVMPDDQCESLLIETSPLQILLLALLLSLRKMHADRTCSQGFERRNESERRSAS